MEALPAELRPDLVPLLNNMAATANDQGEDPLRPPSLARMARRLPVMLAKRAAATNGVEPAVSPRSSHGVNGHETGLRRERKASGSDFAAIVAHELASPIAAIRYLAAMALVGELPPAEQTQALSAISREAEALQALIADLELAVISEHDDFMVQLRPIALSTLVAESLAFARTLPLEHPLSAVIDGDCQVLADPQRIGQVLRNLIENAAKYSPPGTPVDLRATRSRSWIRLEVLDRGPGIPPGDRWRIFEKFERGHAGHHHRRPGLGLGLYLSRRLVQMHGSDLILQPRPGGGSIFGFDLEVVP